MERNYIPSSMSFAEGFMGPKGDIGYSMVIDEKKARKIVRKLLKKGKNIQRITAGLDGDWGVNSCVIWENGKFSKYDAWRDSIWAEPIMIVDFIDAPSEKYSIWKKEK
jgi:hypothetical protein